MNIKYIWCIESDYEMRKLESARGKKYIKYYDDRLLAEKAAFKIFNKAHKKRLEYIRQNILEQKEYDLKNLNQNERLKDSYYENQLVRLKSKSKLKIKKQKTRTRFFNDHLYGMVVRHTLRVS